MFCFVVGTTHPELLYFAEKESYKKELYNNQQLSSNFALLRPERRRERMLRGDFITLLLKLLFSLFYSFVPLKLRTLGGRNLAASNLRERKHRWQK